MSISAIDNDLRMGAQKPGFFTKILRSNPQIM
jgi:hypothetical protein